MKRIQLSATIRALIHIGAAILALSPGLVQAQPHIIGQWETRPEAMSVNPIHVGLLRTGRVLVIAGSGNDPKESVSSVYKATVWDPVGGTIDPVQLPWDLFCNGMSFLPDGRALITGGSKPYPTNNFKGLKNTTIFDPITSIFHQVEDMADGRWYPTNIALPDGRTATFSGEGEDGTNNATAEIYTPGSGWSPEYANGWPASLGNYPRAHLTPHGDLFFSGAQLNSHRFDPIALTWNQNVARTTHGATRRYGSSVLLGLRPPLYTARILIAGGGATAATDSTEIIDLGVSTPRWEPTGSLTFKRVEHNAVLLPNGKILAIGGSNTNNKIDDNGEGRFSEMYDPATGDWSIMAQQLYWRLYHSTALLLPDGRVASLGSNPQQGTYEQHIEIYSPPYLFADNGDLADRPNLTNVPAQIDYTQSFKVTTNTPGAIKEAVLMRPGAATHAFDMEQRLVELEIAPTQDGKLQLVGPPSANIAPPGYYMLFLINSAGVPSVARFVQLVSNPSNTPPPSPQAPSSPPPPVPPAPLPLSPPSPPELAPQCSSTAATVFVRDGFIIGGIDNGTLYNGRLRGTQGSDVIVGTTGNDILEGLGGNDWICGGAGNDTIKGGKGNDRLFGQSGKDKLTGGSGRSDRCSGGPGKDTFTTCERTQNQ